MQADNRASITIDGNLHKDWLRYSIDSDYFTPADAWQMSLGMPAGKMPAYVRPWTSVQVRVGDSLAMTGRSDNLSRHISKDAHTLDLSGRDGAAILLDCSAPVFSQREVTVEEVCATMLRPLGVDRIEVQKTKDAYKKVTVEPGMTAWDALQRAAEASGLWPWFTPDGVLKVAAPDYGREIDAELILAFDGKQNNVLDLSFAEGCERRYSEVTVLGQSTGDEDDEADTKVRHVVKDDGAWFYRPLIRDEGHVDNADKAKAKARKIITDGVMESLTATAKVHGHRTDKGELWEPGMHVRLRAEPFACDLSLMLTRRVMQGGREGTTTALTLKPWGIWLPDTAKKPKGKKKRGDGDETDFDLGD
jgi:prophage tail gpP-like protein